MKSTIYINPDSYLETDHGRVFTAERNARAWKRAFSELAVAVGTYKKLYVVVGIQGSGKTTWVQANQPLLAGSVVFDAALPGKKHRAKVLAIAEASGCSPVAIWVDTPLEVALQRNKFRASDERVPEAAIRNVFSIFEPPSTNEGFIRVTKVSGA
jgi:predicted kinase